jgi:hypothetical protein
MDIFDFDLEPAPSTFSRSSSSTLSAKGVRELEREVGRHRLLIEVLLRAIVDKGIYTREQLNAMANLVDMEDGVRDGRLKKESGVKHCSKCARVMMNVSGQCLYCGHQEVLKLV